MGGVEYQVTKVDPTDPETKGMVYQVHKVSEEIAATLGGKVYRARIINDPTDPTVAGKVYQIVLIGDPDDPAVKGKVYNAILTGGSEAVVVGPAVSPLALPDAIANSLSYVKAFGGTEQRNLPDGYTQLEYIVFDTTQVIDTGFTPDNNSRIESKCYRTGANCWFYGAGPSNPRVTLFHSDSGTSRWGNQSRSGFGLVANTEYTFIQDKNGLNINGVDNPWTSGTADDFTCDRSLTIGNNNGSTGIRYFAGNFYYMKIYDNGVLARDFVPCKNASNVVGLYDRVNGVFYTDTGLVAGPVVVPAPDAPIDIVCNNGVLKVRHQSGLPLGYTALDYVSFDGVSSSGAYVDTGIEFYNQIPNNKIRIKAKAKVYNQSSWQVICGNLGSVSAYTGINPENKIAYGFGSNDAITDVVNPEVLCVFDLDLVSGTYKVTNTSTGVDIVNITEIVPVASTNVRNILLGGYNNSSGTIINNRTKMDFESAEIYNDGVLVSKLIPCKNSSNVVGCYDVVRDVFLTNIVGSTNLVAGSTVSDPVEIYTDGTVETIQIQHQLELPTTNTYGNITDTYNYLYNVNADTVAVPVTIGKQYIIKWTNTTQATVGSVFRYGFVSDSTPTGQAVTQGYRGTIQNLPSNPIIVTADNSYLLLQCNQKYTIPNITNGYLTVSEVSNIATAEMLLKVGDYQDEQEILSGAVTRKVGIKVFDGTEGWVKGTSFYADISLGALQAAHSCICNYYAGKSTNPYSADSNTIQVGYKDGSLTFWNRVYITANRAEYATAADFKAYLAAQYAAGTPVIVLYPLATPTTESVTGQTLQVTDGDNVLEITQASIDGLELEAEYEKEAE